MHYDDTARRRLHAADDLTLWYEALHEMAERARRAGDRATEILAVDAGEGLLALADRLLYGETPWATHGKAERLTYGLITACHRSCI